MTGAEHAAKAEELLTGGGTTEMIVARAQVHATLALVAATEANRAGAAYNVTIHNPEPEGVSDAVRRHLLGGGA
jgi:hypothetical protein